MRLYAVIMALLVPVGIYVGFASESAGGRIAGYVFAVLGLVAALGAWRRWKADTDGAA